MSYFLLDAIMEIGFGLNSFYILQNQLYIANSVIERVRK